MIKHTLITFLKSAIFAVLTVAVPFITLSVFDNTKTNNVNHEHEDQVPVAHVKFTSSDPIFLKADHRGLYTVEGKINGHDVAFLIDTGATSTSIPLAFANRIGMEILDPIKAMTGGGQSIGYVCRANNVSAGNLTTLHPMDLICFSGLDSPKPIGTFLLGMDVLEHFTIDINDGRMILSGYTY